MTQTATSSEIQLPFNDTGFEAFIESRRKANEPEWLLEMRRDAWQTFQELPWPSQRDEEWMRTDIRLFDLDKFSLASEPQATPLPEPILSKDVELVGSLATHNGNPRDENPLDAKWADKGVIFGRLSEMVGEHSELIQRYLMRLVDRNTDKFSALHAAIWTGGTFLYVPRGVVVDQPLHVFSALSDGGSDFGHTLVILEDGAEATLLAESACCQETDSGLHCGGIELVVGDRANLRYVNLQDWSQSVWHFAHQKANVGKDANLQWTVAALGSRLAKVNQHVGLVGEGANCQVNGVMFTENRQHLSYHTLQHHRKPSCTSDFLYKAALQDTSRTVWRGMIKVDEEAQKTDGYQRNDNLLLTDKSRADSIPGLEIEADDVRCTHGSTSGQVDEELIFYARCRGFTRKEAIRAIVIGFFQQVFDRISIESVREALGFAIARRVREYE